MRRPEGWREAALAAALAIACVCGFAIADPGGLAFAAREAVFDRWMALYPRQGPDTGVIVAGIDSESLERLGAWPWRRAQLAALVEEAARRRPRAVALNILLEGEDRNGPRAALSRWAEREKRPDLAEIASQFPDDDALLVKALAAGAPVALSLGLALRATGAEIPSLAIGLLGERPADFTPPRAQALAAPPPALIVAAAGLGVLSLDTDRDGVFRRIPLLFLGAGGGVHAGFAFEAVRLAEGGGAPLYDSDTRRFEMSGTKIAVPRDGLARFYPRPQSYWTDRIIPAWRLAQEASARIGPGSLVIIGSAAPEAGAFLPTARGAEAALMLQAEAVDQLLSGVHVARAPFSPWSEIAAAVLLGALAAIAAIFLPPLFAALASLALFAFALGGSLLLFSRIAMLADATPALAAIAAAAAAASLAVHGRVRANRALVEARFARYLAPAVVEMLARDPGRLRIEAQRREVTALFTDLEGFTPFSERTPPAEFIATLDRYYEMIAAIVVEHGGMVDKIVGDALHAFFNMPLDQPDHASRAVACARAIKVATDAYRNEPRQKALALGRTRIGVDTGLAIVGDVGGRGKLDYTAHGEAINRAARLQSMARDYDSGVLIGEGTVSRLQSREGLKSVGLMTPRGISVGQEVFTLE